MRQDAPVLPHLLLVAMLCVGSCALDEAELFRAGAPQITAEVGQLRVLSYDDDPVDDWVDVVAPDPAVFEEGDSFREADSRTADDDQPAEERRLFTGLRPGRTLLVQLNEVDDDVLVWDLVVGDPEQPFSDGTSIARVGRSTSVDVGDRFAVVRAASAGPEDAVFAAGEEPIVALVARHQPDAGADLFVDVFVAMSAGRVGLVYGDEKFGIDIS